MAKKQRSNTPDFYEAMPGMMDHYDLFPPAMDYDLPAEPDLDQQNDTEFTSDDARRRITRQGVFLLGLLVLQIVLFVALIRSAVNLG